VTAIDELEYVRRGSGRYPGYHPGAPHPLAAVGRQPLVDDQVANVDRDDRERVDVDREQIPVLRWLDAALGLQPDAKA
jgi:hypothetical protein